MADPYENIGPGTPYPGEGGLLRPPAEATGLSAIRVLRNGSLRCPADAGCDECDAVPDVPDYSPIPGQIDLLAMPEGTTR